MDEYPVIDAYIAVREDEALAIVWEGCVEVSPCFALDNSFMLYMVDNAPSEGVSSSYVRESTILDEQIKVWNLISENHLHGKNSYNTPTFFEFDGKSCLV